MASKKDSQIPKYCLHKSSGRARVTLNGKDFWLGRYGTPGSREKYDRLIAEWMANGRNPPIQARDGLTVVEVMATFWRYAQELLPQARWVSLQRVGELPPGLATAE